MSGRPPADPAAFIRANTRPNTTPLVPEIRLWLADEIVPIWQLTEEELAEKRVPPPFWAFAWAGGQAIARYVLDTAQIAEGRRVLDFASGCAIAGIAAMRAGAQDVLCADIDPFAEAAARINAEENGASLRTTTQNLIGTPVAQSLILAGDICYEEPLASDVAAWLHGCAKGGATVLIGDPGRTYLPKSGLEALATYRVETTRELEDNDVRRTTVYRVMA